jgi:adenosylcobinamide-GDP ribazoletransferase
MMIRDFADDVARATGFLSRLRVPDRFFQGFDGRLDRAVRAFGVAGVLIALPAAAVLAVALAVDATPLLSAFIALAALTLITGALHEDGLADTADGLGGGRNRDRMLEIMRDSRIGTYGACALVISFGLRAAALASVGTLHPPLTVALGFLSAAMLSRTAMVWHWRTLPPARSDGTAASAGRPEQDAVRVAIALAILFTLVLVWPSMGLGAAGAALAAAGLAAWGASRYIQSRLGGHTGDTIGATQQCCEIAVLCALALCA